MCRGLQLFVCQNVNHRLTRSSLVFKYYIEPKRRDESSDLAPVFHEITRLKMCTNSDSEPKIYNDLCYFGSKIEIQALEKGTKTDLYLFGIDCPPLVTMN